MTVQRHIAVKLLHYLFMLVLLLLFLQINKTTLRMGNHLRVCQNSFIMRRSQRHVWQNLPVGNQRVDFVEFLLPSQNIWTSLIKLFGRPLSNWRTTLQDKRTSFVPKFEFQTWYSNIKWNLRIAFIFFKYENIAVFSITEVTIVFSWLFSLDLLDFRTEIFW